MEENIDLELQKKRKIQVRRLAIEAEKKALVARLERNHKRRTRTESLSVILWIAIITIVPLSVLLGISTRPLVAVCTTLPAYALISIGLVWMIRAQARTIEEAIHDRDFEDELLSSEATTEETRAEELLRMHQYQLRRYYDLNLNQNFWVFTVGILCILLGAVVVGLTIFLISNSPQASWQEKTTLGLVGAVGSLMTNYIAAIYLKMHSAITGTLATFHGTLAATHKLYLANLLVSRIGDTKRREEALAKLSLAVAEHKDNQPPKSQPRRTKVTK